MILRFSIYYNESGGIFEISIFNPVHEYLVHLQYTFHLLLIGVETILVVHNFKLNLCHPQIDSKIFLNQGFFHGMKDCVNLHSLISKYLSHLVLIYRINFFSQETLPQSYAMIAQTFTFMIKFIVELVYFNEMFSIKILLLRIFPLSFYIFLILTQYILFINMLRYSVQQREILILKRSHQLNGLMRLANYEH